VIWFPYVRHTFNTISNKDEIRSKIQTSTESLKFYWWYWLSRSHYLQTDKPFYGTILGDRFRIKRIIDYRNSFLPVIHGKISDNKVAISLRPSIFVLLFIIIWSVFPSILLGVALRVMVQEHYFSIYILLPLGMLCFAYGLLINGFGKEVNKTIEIMEEILTSANHIA